MTKEGKDVRPDCRDQVRPAALHAARHAGPRGYARAPFPRQLGARTEVRYSATHRQRVFQRRGEAILGEVSGREWTAYYRRGRCANHQADARARIRLCRASEGPGLRPKPPEAYPLLRPEGRGYLVGSGYRADESAGGREGPSAGNLASEITPSTSNHGSAPHGALRLFYPWRKTITSPSRTK